MEGPGKRLRVYIGEAHTWHGVPLAHAIVTKARERGLAGATVQKGILGFGAHRHVHAAALIEIEADLPVIVEIVDQAERIAAFVPVLDEIIGEGMVTIEDVTVLLHRPPKPRGA